MKFRRIFAAAMLVCGSAGAAVAQGQTKGWFLTAEGGYSYLNAFNSTNSPAGLQFHASPTNGFAAGMDGGYDFGYLSIMGEGFYRHADVNSLFVRNGGTSFPALTGVSIGPFGAVSDIAAMVNFKVDFLPQSRWTPYVGAGIGGGWTRLSGLGVANTTIVNNTTFDFAWQIMAGVTYQLSPKVSLGLDYRYFATTDASSKDLAGASFNAAYGTQNIMLALTYHFGVPKPRPPPPVAAPPPPELPPVPASRLYLVYFDFDKSTITQAGAATIQQAADDYKQHGSVQIQVAGYTDLAGSAQYNLALSKRRAEAVTVYLVRLGVPQSAIDATWYGKENPRVPTPDGVREPQNRRVEITVP
jgi:outer membrane protein OmpA-like peptidoglycan-associated protein